MLNQVEQLNSTFQDKDQANTAINGVGGYHEWIGT